MTEAAVKGKGAEGAGSGLEAVRARLAAAEAAAGRPPGSVALIAVSKEQPEDRVRAVLEAGHRLFGENRVQEARARWEPLTAATPGIMIHLVGPLQTNKARAAMALFAAIHSLDRPRLAETLARLADERGACPDLLVQVNTGEEPQKAGVAPGEARALLALTRRLSLPVQGLMCIPPEGADPVPHFRLLRAMAESEGLSWLSMGMSGDFETAVAEGATHVRVGRAVFGARR
ncbi:pyridoxal phosphate enzyme, YggS family [Rubellimicrobium thermophilum DSM 16684]|uniref:Pyridoxal phosphate homeostasis protein n=1 Tax=Rubellimicrobium thermophilum DSM 16684 TaxID=1123069 RepID=S9RXD8_9RHOB|nr:YggS family pyridoxal phosphate-dependent enzyme [Rubellimicrobium thermophilum]EPX82680.1 pyridoxal phosphate enzyme, YggS family [Rubellimicrobium thermophilum DSM 16684]